MCTEELVVGYHFGVLSFGCSHFHLLLGSDLAAVAAELTLKVSINNNAQKHMKGNTNSW